MTIDYKQIAINNTRILATVAKYNMRNAGPGASFFVEREKDVLQLQIATSRDVVAGHNNYMLRIIPDDMLAHNDVAFSSDDLDEVVKRFIEEINKGVEGIDTFVNTI